MNTTDVTKQPPARTDELLQYLRGSAWLLAMLEVVEQSNLPEAWIGAGVIRDIVWDTKFGSGFDPSRVKDIDVAYFDTSDLSRERDAAATHALESLGADITWDAKNQAAVHTWYQERFGVQVEPLSSIEEAVATGLRQPRPSPPASRVTGSTSSPHSASTTYSTASGAGTPLASRSRNHVAVSMRSSQKSVG